MTTQETNVAASEAQAVETPPAPPSRPPKKKKKLNRAVKRIITVVVILAVIAAIGFSLWWFLFREKEEESEIMPATATRKTIQSTVQGSGNARAGASSAITFPADGTIREVFVNVGDQVFEGQPLYTAYSPAAEANVSAAEKAVTDQKETIATLQKELENRRKEYADMSGRASELTIRAPFDGNLRDVAEIKPGDELSAGTKLATIVNDRHLKLSLYFSYGYENDIYVGQTASVSIPQLMLTLDGEVEEIYKVKRPTVENGILFEVVIGLDNPGTLTADMEASASMVTAAGVNVFPYENGKLEYSGSEDIVATQAGKVESTSSLRDYTDVSAGQVLAVQSADTFNNELSAKSDEIKAAEQRVTDAETRLAELEEAVVKAKEGVENLDAMAPISGTITSCTVVEGSEVTGGTTIITISDTTNMTVEITVDDRNISYVKPGMEVELADWNGNYFVGVVTNIDMGYGGDFGSMGGSGMTNYPVTLSVENSSGSLLQGMWLDYSFVTSESVDCLTVPIQCVKNIVDLDGNPHTVVFIQADEKPENAIEFEMPENYYGSTPAYPSGEEGYWPVPVETGLSDRYDIEITSGLSDGDTVFSAYMMTGAWG